MRHRLPIVFALLAMLYVLVGCSKIKEKIAEKMSEKAAEAVIEAKTGEKVQIDQSDGKVRVQSKDGKGTFVVGENKVPDDFPKNVPVYPGAKVESAMAATGGQGDSGFILTLSTPDAADKVAAFYKDAASKNGAKQLLDMQTPAGHMVSWQTTDALSASAVVSGDASENKTTIMLQASAKRK